MPAAVETAVYANTPAWHGLGTVLDSEGKLGLDVETALRESGLDWTVRKVPDFAPAEWDTVVVNGKPALVPQPGADLVRVPGRYLVQRQSDNQYLGSVGATWQPVQNIEGFKLVDDLIQMAGGGQAYVESANARSSSAETWATFSSLGSCTSTSTRRSRLRCMRSAEPIQTLGFPPFSNQ